MRAYPNIRPGILAGLLLAASLAACGPAPPPPTLVNLKLTAAADANAGPDGRGAPVSLRVYQLASPAGFEGAQFFQLFNGDTAIKDDLVKRDDILLAPGTDKELALSPTDKVKAIGILAAYRDYEHVAWRAVVPVPANKTSSMTVVADKAGVTAKIVPAK